jgi:2-oxoglutarate ferredoxin oxidoreductase subunit alpha
LEKDATTGAVSYDGPNHQEMIAVRANKVARVADVIPPIEVGGDVDADTLLLGWGGTQGAILSAAERLQADDMPMAIAHLRHLNPMPSNLGEVLARYQNVIIPEVNSGQLCMLLRGKFLVDAKPINVIQGRGFHVDELVGMIKDVLKEAGQ